MKKGGLREKKWRDGGNFPQDAGKGKKE